MSRAGTTTSAGSSNNHNPLSDCIGYSEMVIGGKKHSILKNLNGSISKISFDNSLNAANAVPEDVTKLCLGRCVKKIDFDTFRDTRSLSGEVFLPLSLKEIHSLAFYETGPVEIDFSLSVLSYLGIRTFQKSKIKNKVILPNTLNRIERECFMGCQGIEEVFIPKSLTDPNNPFEQPDDWDGKDPSGKGAGMYSLKAAPEAENLDEFADCQERINYRKFYFDDSTSGIGSTQQWNSIRDEIPQTYTDPQNNQRVIIGYQVQVFPNFCEYVGGGRENGTFYAYFPLIETFGEKFLTQLDTNIDFILYWANDGGDFSSALPEVIEGAGKLGQPINVDNNFYLQLEEATCAFQFSDLDEENRGWGDSTFEDCVNLKKIALEDGLRYIPRNSFSNCKRAEIGKLDTEELFIPDTIEFIEDYAFRGTAFKEITFGLGDINFIGTGAFSRIEDLVTLNFDPDHTQVTRIDPFAFTEANLQNDLYLPKNIESIGLRAFYDSLGEAELGAYAELHFNEITNNNLFLDINAFGKSFIKPHEDLTPTILHGVSGVGFQAFANTDWEANHKIVLPDSVQSVEDQAFKNFKYTDNITFEIKGSFASGTRPEFGNDVFDNGDYNSEDYDTYTGDSSLTGVSIAYSNVDDQIAGGPNNGVVEPSGNTCGNFFIQEDDDNFGSYYFTLDWDSNESIWIGNMSNNNYQGGGAQLWYIRSEQYDSRAVDPTTGQWSVTDFGGTSIAGSVAVTAIGEWPLEPEDNVTLIVPSGEYSFYACGDFRQKTKFAGKIIEAE